MLKQGDTIHINQKPYVLGKCLGEGAQGQVFELADFPNKAVKICSDNLDASEANETFEHYKWLMEMGQKDCFFCHTKLKGLMSLPIALVDDHLGYLMDNASGYESLINYLDKPEDNDKFFEWYKTNYTLKKRYQIIINIFRHLRELHTNGLIFTDLSPNNIMVNKKQNGTYFIDTDNIKQKSDLYCSVKGTVGYMAPELYEYNDSKKIDNKDCDEFYGRISVDTDIFSAAVIAFELLTFNHPFIGDEIDEADASYEEAAKEIKTDYIFKEGTSNVSTKELCPFFDKLTTPEIRKLFYRTFVDSVKNPAVRPTDEEFVEAFQKAFELIYTCPKCGFSMIYNPGEKNVCFGCDDEIDKQVFFVISREYYNMSEADIVNGCGTNIDKKYEVDELFKACDKGSTNTFELSRILIQPANPNFLTGRYVHVRHIEGSHGRTQVIFTLKLDDTGRQIQLSVVSLPFKDMSIRNINKNSIYALKKDTYNFDVSNHYIYFTQEHHGKNYAILTGRFVRE